MGQGRPSGPQRHGARVGSRPHPALIPSRRCSAADCYTPIAWKLVEPAWACREGCDSLRACLLHSLPSGNGDTSGKSRFANVKRSAHQVAGQEGEAYEKAAHPQFSAGDTVGCDSGKRS
jgi:hypothetical protein